MTRTHSRALAACIEAHDAGTAIQPRTTRPQPIGQQLVTALRDARAGDDQFPAYAVGYLEGMLNDIAGQVPAARALIQHHIDAARVKAIGAAA